MGFDRDLVKRALRAHRGRDQEALEAILSGDVM